ncbi:hypothetical protein SD78_2865 [Bacillus badius]|nr:hypothetical protein SD78_2865 [Bacillus badius]
MTAKGTCQHLVTPGSAYCRWRSKSQEETSKQAIDRRNRQKASVYLKTDAFLKMENVLA